MPLAEGHAAQTVAFEPDGLDETPGVIARGVFESAAGAGVFRLVGAHLFEHFHFGRVEAFFHRENRLEHNVADTGRPVAVRYRLFFQPARFGAECHETVENLVFLQSGIHFQHAAECPGKVR